MLPRPLLDDGTTARIESIDLKGNNLGLICNTVKRVDGKTQKLRTILGSESISELLVFKREGKKRHILPLARSKEGEIQGERKTEICACIACLINAIPNLNETLINSSLLYALVQGYSSLNMCMHMTSMFHVIHRVISDMKY